MIKTEMYANRISKPQLSEHGKYTTILSQFMNSSNMTLKLLCSNTKEANSAYACISSQNKKHNYGLVLWKKNCEVYVIKG